MPDGPTRFWMCFVEGGQTPPRVRHATINDAAHEAARLAEATGKTVYVMGAAYRIARGPVESVYLMPVSPDTLSSVNLFAAVAKEEA